MKVTKNRYLKGFASVVVVLALARVIFPDLAKSKLTAKEIAGDSASLAENTSSEDASSEDASLENTSSKDNFSESISTDNTKGGDNPEGTDPQKNQDLAKDELSVTPDTAKAGMASIFFDKEGREVKHRIFSVPHFGNTFPDQQDVQILAANKHGVAPVQNRAEAEHSKGKLVYVGSNPFFYVDKLNNSIPYLVPRASVLLQDIGRAYFDSLQIKGIPLHKIIVTSILRTKDDVAKLRTRNGNATENSCHLYGTTFDVCYNRYKQIQTRKEPRRQVQNDTLKWVLSEVLRDFRAKNRCYIKYEVNQGCFHITVR